MSIRPLKFNDDGSIDVWHDELNHGGTVAVGKLAFVKRQDGSLDTDKVLLECPVAGCHSHSEHPVGGGCDPEMVQRMFVRFYRASVDVPDAKDWDTAAELVAARIEATDGPQRVKLAGAHEGEATPADVLATEAALAAERREQEKADATTDALAVLANDAELAHLTPVLKSLLDAGMDPAESLKFLKAGAGGG